MTSPFQLLAVVIVPELLTPSNQCDGAVPSCGACLKVDVNCVDGGKQDGIESTRLWVFSSHPTRL